MSGAGGVVDGGDGGAWTAVTCGVGKAGHVEANGKRMAGSGPLHGAGCVGFQTAAATGSPALAAGACTAQAGAAAGSKRSGSFASVACSGRGSWWPAAQPTTVLPSVMVASSAALAGLSNLTTTMLRDRRMEERRRRCERWQQGTWRTHQACRVRHQARRQQRRCSVQ